jgi:putative zinc-binding metallo-peptidase
MERREVETPTEPPWVALSDEELLKLRICDLHVRVEGSELEPRVAQLYEELAARGIALRPQIYLGDEWFSPEGLAAVAIPFYLAHPRLKSLELHQMMEVEGGTPEWCMKLLRHECGHALDHSYRFSERRKWQQIFGSPEAEYAPEHYRPRPYSRSFVRHLDNWYAQAHPDEDFAETFAVWLASPASEWRARYRRWKALEKLEYIEELMQEAKKPPMPQPARKRRISEASKLRKTLERHYHARRKLYAEDFPDFYDGDLRTIFASGVPDGEPAARFMRQHRTAIVASVDRWTGQRKYTISMLVRKLILRAQQLDLRCPRDTTRVCIEVAAYLSALVTNHLHTGRYKRTV